jgi:hypothetical protein
MIIPVVITLIVWVSFTSSAKASPFTECLTGLNPVLPSMSGYNSATASYNKRIPLNPVALVYAGSPEQVSQSMICGI